MKRADDKPSPGSTSALSNPSSQRSVTLQSEHARVLLSQEPSGNLLDIIIMKDNIGLNASFTDRV